MNSSSLDAPSRFFRFFFGTVLVTTGFLLSVNYWVDPADYFSEREFVPSKIALALAKGDNVLVPTFRDERSVQKMRIHYDDSHPETLIIGSSRSMLLNSQVAGSRVINLSVSGCTLQDYLPLAMTSVDKFTPRKIILGLDPWIFNENFGSVVPSFNKEYLVAAGKLQIPGIVFAVAPSARVGDLMSLEYTWVSLHSLFGILFRRPSFFPTQANVASGDLELIHQDGSISYQPKIEQRSVEEANALAREYTRSPIFGFDHYLYSKEKDEALFRLLQYLQTKTTVELFLPPYNPIAFAQIKQSTPQVIAVESRLREMAGRLGITVVGSYDPAPSGCQPEDFFDGMHGRISMYRKVFSPVP